MPKYDAFGREIGEDTLASWRTGESGPAVPTEEPPVEAEPAPRQQPAATDPQPAVLVTQAPSPSPEASSPTGERVVRVQMPPAAAFRRRRRPRVVSRLIVLIVLIAVGTTVAANVGREIEDAIREVPGLQPEPAEPPPAGLQAGSLIRPGELRRALADLRDRNLGRVQHLRLAPERIDAALLDGRGTMRSVQLRHDGGFDEFSASRGLGHLETIPWNRLDPNAPSRLVRRAARRLERPVTRIDYLVATPLDGNVMWGAYFKGGQMFQGDARGRLVRRVS